jgi:putative transposase
MLTRSAHHSHATRQATKEPSGARPRSYDHVNNTHSLRRPVEPGQYTAVIFGSRCEQLGIDVSMGSIGDCYDNAVCEAFHSTLKRELVHRRPWPTRAELKTAVFAYIEGFYNTRRRHSTLNHDSPVQYEARYATE